jgi:hypothetical protein
MEILHKEGGGGDAPGFGWQLPSELERPLPHLPATYGGAQLL